MIRFVLDHLKDIIPEAELQKKVLLRSIGVIAWISFLFAGLASMIFFSTFNPPDLIAYTTFNLNLSTTGVYTIGFVLFWLLCFSSTISSCILLALPIEKRSKSMPE